jgi:hypothetical protein
MAAAYNAFVARPTGIIERLSFRHSFSRREVSGRIDRIELAAWPSRGKSPAAGQREADLLVAETVPLVSARERLPIRGVYLSAQNFRRWR